MELFLQGPSKYIRKDKVFKNISKADIIDASIQCMGTITPLQANSFQVDRKIDCFFVYHSFDFILDEDGSVSYGRWYNGNFPLDAFKKMDGCSLHVRFEEYEVKEGVTCPADFTIHFTEKTAGELKNMF